MSHLVESDPLETLEFKWGKRGPRGKKKEIQFYESFTYDGVDYTLYDNVYLYKEGEPEPYIGKLVKIYENEESKMKLVRVHWFFRPSEISNWIEEGMALEKEIFLASGEIKYAVSVNSLEAISGKCNVVCTLQDERNPQPSAQELDLANYFFYRTFDVDHFTISDLKGDKVAGLEVKFVFNRKENKKDTGLISDKKQVGEKISLAHAMYSGDVANSSFQKTLSKSKDKSLNGGSGKTETEKKNVILDKAGVEDIKKVTKGSGPSQNKFPSKSVVDGIETLQKNRNPKGAETLNVHGNKLTPLAKTVSFSDKKPNYLFNKAEVEEAVTVAKGSADLKNRPTSKSVVDGSEASWKDKNKKRVETNVVGSDPKPLTKSSSFTDKQMKNGETSDSMGLNKVVKADKPVHPITKHVKGVSQELPATHGENSIRKRKSSDVCLGPERDPKLHKMEEKMAKFSNEKLPKVSATHGKRTEFAPFEVTRKPINESREWFDDMPWEEDIKSAYGQGRVLQLSNLDPEYTSGEVEDLIWNAFEKHCTAKMVRHTANSNPHYGYALIIMKTRPDADLVFKKLEDGCLMLPNMRTLVASRVPLNFSENQSTFIGHLSVDKMKHKRERVKALSTAHFSQSNTSEFHMAEEWCLLQRIHDRAWEGLHKQQGDELRKLMRNLKSA